MPSHDDLLAPPRSVLLALWLHGIGAGAAPVQRAVEAISGDDEPHTVVRPDQADGTLAELVASWAAGPRQAVALTPVPGDVSGVPAGVADLAAEAEECVLVRTGGRSWAAVPEVVEFGSVHETGHLVTWQVREVPDWHLRLPGIVGTLSEADQELRRTLLEATDALAGLDVARWRPDAAEAIASLRSEAAHGWPLPGRLAPRAVRVLVTALRLRGIVSLATADDGGAINLWQADQRSAALRHLDHAARRAVGAATLAAADPGGPPGL